MTIEQKGILQDICDMPLPETMLTPLETYEVLADKSESIADTWLLGYLLEKRTTVRVFGEEEIAECGLKLMSSDFEDRLNDLWVHAKWDEWSALKEENPQYCYGQDDPECPCGTIEAFRWHSYRLVDLSDSLEAVLDYYGKYLGGANEHV